MCYDIIITSSHSIVIIIDCIYIYLKCDFSAVSVLRASARRVEAEQNVKHLYSIVEVLGIGNGPVDLELERATDV